MGRRESGSPRFSDKGGKDFECEKKKGFFHQILKGEGGEQKKKKGGEGGAFITCETKAPRREAF